MTPFDILFLRHEFLTVFTWYFRIVYRGPEEGEGFCYRHRFEGRETWCKLRLRKCQNTNWLDLWACMASYKKDLGVLTKLSFSYHTTYYYSSSTPRMLDLFCSSTARCRCPFGHNSIFCAHTCSDSCPCSGSIRLCWRHCRNCYYSSYKHYFFAQSS